MDNKLGTLIRSTQEKYTYHANKHQSPHPNYKVGDLVYVDPRHMATTRPKKGLDWKFLGPWPMIRVMDDKAFELEIPQDRLEEGLTPVFHSWKLSLASADPFPGQTDIQEEKITIYDKLQKKTHFEYEVTEIVDFRETRRWGVQYKVTYAGEWNEWNTSHHWQPWTDFIIAKDLVLEYHRLNPKKLPPPANLLNPSKSKDTVKAQGTSQNTAGGSVRPSTQPDNIAIIPRRSTRIRR